MLKAIAGGGGRGMREVHAPGSWPQPSSTAVPRRCRLGNGELSVEQLLPHARRISVQILGDGTEIAHLWDRECSAQRQHQKLIETAPAFGLTSDMRATSWNCPWRWARR